MRTAASYPNYLSDSWGLATLEFFAARGVQTPQKASTVAVPGLPAPDTLKVLHNLSVNGRLLEQTPLRGTEPTYIMGRKGEETLLAHKNVDVVRQNCALMGEILQKVAQNPGARVKIDNVCDDRVDFLIRQLVREGRLEQASSHHAIYPGQDVRLSVAGRRHLDCMGGPARG